MREREITGSEQLRSQKLRLVQMDNIMLSRLFHLQTGAPSGYREAQWRPQGMNVFKLI